MEFLVNINKLIVKNLKQCQFVYILSMAEKCNVVVEKIDSSTCSINFDSKVSLNLFLKSLDM